MEYKLQFFDFEVYPKLWCVTFMDINKENVKVIVNNRTELRDYFNKYQDTIFVGYNNRNYDDYIAKGICLGLNPYEISDWIVNKGRKAFEYSPMFRYVQIYTYDCMNKFNSLKTLEGYMGSDIRETEIPFDYAGEFTDDMLKQVLYYNKHDVEQTVEVFKNTINEFKAQTSLIETFNLSLENISKTKAQLTALIIGCSKREYTGDEFNLRIVDTLKLDKYKYVLDWFMNPDNHKYIRTVRTTDKKGKVKEREEKVELRTDVAGIPHVFAWGGLHGCVDKPIQVNNDDCYIFHCDGNSFYPSIMIQYDMLTRACKDKNKFKEIYEKRLALKKAGKKKEQAPLKIVINSVYGVGKGKFSKAYDPLQANNVCVNGQLLLLDLIEHLEPYIELLQSNTDGIIFKCSKDKLDTIKSVCSEWEQRTRISLEIDEIKQLIQRDVNNYACVFCNNKSDRKGAVVKENNDIDNDLPIINEAIYKYLIDDISIQDTILNCNELIKFQRIVKISSKYKFAMHNGARLDNKTFRIFASKNEEDGIIGKCKSEGATVEKFANTPMHCFIDNTNIVGKQVPPNLDKQYYIDLAQDRLEKFLGI